MLLKNIPMGCGLILVENCLWSKAALCAPLHAASMLRACGRGRTGGLLAPAALRHWGRSDSLGWGAHPYNNGSTGKHTWDSDVESGHVDHSFPWH